MSDITSIGVPVAYACPSWCAALDHPRRGRFEAADPPTHVQVLGGEEPGLDVQVVQVETNPGASVVVGGIPVTAGGADILAGLLLEAARVVRRTDITQRRRNRVTGQACLPPMSPHVDDFRRFLVAHGHPEGTVEQYTNYVRRVERDLDRHLMELSAEDLLEWLAHYEHWKPETRRQAVKGLKAFYGWAVAMGHIRRDPCAALKTLRHPVRVPRPTPDALYDEAVRGCKTDSERMLLRLAAETGLRRAELAAVHSQDVRRYAHGWGLFVTGKGGRERVVPLPDDLAGWVAAREGWLFPSPDGRGHYRPASVGKVYKRLLGGTQWTTHTLRHRFATTAYARTKDLEAVRRLMGHDSLRTTQQYIQVAEETLWTVAGSTWEGRQ